MGHPGPDGQEGRYSFDQQMQLLHSAVAEAEGKDLQTNLLKGPFVNDFNAIFTTTIADLREIDHLYTFDLPYESLAPSAYRTPEITALVASLTKEDKLRLDDLKERRRESTNRLAGLKIAPTISLQEIPEGRLTIPEYRRMVHANRLCTNACFRMISSDVTGMTMQEDFVENAVTHGDKTRFVPDDDYWKLLQTEVFEKQSRMGFSITRFVGASLGTINRFAEGLRTRQADPRIYCVVNLQSGPATDKDTWHTAVLLKATRDDVFLYDPMWSLHGSPGENIPVPKPNFARRWATAQNSGLLIAA